MEKNTTRFIKEYVDARGGLDILMEEEKQTLLEMATRFDTSAYENSHSKKPKGKGNWGFGASKKPKPADVFFFNGPYAEAKKKAKGEFSGQMVIWVLP